MSIRTMLYHVGRVQSLLLITLSLVVSVCSAATITYSDQAVATGTLGANTFTNALVIVTFTGDTTNVTRSPGFFSNVVGTATVNVAGLGVATFVSSSMDVFDNQFFAPTAAAGIGDLGLGASVLDTFNSAFASYDLTTVIGPLSGPSFIRPDITFNTNRGGFNLVAAGNSTFTASAVPEPSAGVMLGIGIGLLALSSSVRRCRR